MDKPVMRHYSQNNPRWAKLMFAGGRTFASDGCLVCGVAMVSSLAYTEELTPVEVAYHLRKAGAFRGALLSLPERIPDALALLTWGGALHFRDVPADLHAIADEIATYGATIAEVLWNPNLPLTYTDISGNTRWNQHFVVLTAIGADGEVTLVDPWDGVEKRLGESRYCLDGWNAARTIYGIRRVRPVL